MTGTPETPGDATAPAVDRGADAASWERPSRLGRAAAAVGIVAGVVLIVGVVFFSGFFLGSRLEHRSGPQVMRCEMDRSGEEEGGMGPGGMGPKGPGQPPSSTSTAPTTPSTPRP